MYDMIATWIMTNDFFSRKSRSGSDVYMPDTIYPHIHVGRDFVTFSKSSSSHKYLAQGDQVFKNALEAVIDEVKVNMLQPERNADIIQVCRYIISQF